MLPNSGWWLTWVWENLLRFILRIGMESQERSRLIKRTIRADDRSGRSPFNHIFEAIACGKTGFFMKNMLRLFLLLLLHVTAIPLKLKKVIPWWLLTLLPPENLKKYDFLDSSNSTNFIREPQMQSLLTWISLESLLITL